MMPVVQEYAMKGDSSNTVDFLKIFLTKPMVKAVPFSFDWGL